MPIRYGNGTLRKERFHTDKAAHRHKNKPKSHRIKKKNNSPYIKWKENRRRKYIRIKIGNIYSFSQCQKQKRLFIILPSALLSM